MRNIRAKAVLLLLGGLLALGLVWAIEARSSEAQQGAMHNCPQAGKWAISVWEGPSGTAAADALATCGAGAVDFAYYLDPATNTWLGYFRDRPEISRLLMLNEMQGIIAHGAVGVPLPTPTISRTEVNVIQPAALSVVQEVEGYCWVGSLTTMRPDAWRCMDDNKIRDPCFSESDADSFVICPSGPPEGMAGVKMNLTEPLPLFYRNTQDDPSYAWIMDLVGGTRCIFIAGATTAIDGERVNYMCDDNWWVIGFPKVDTVWTVRKILTSSVSCSDQPVAEAEVAVVTVWR